MYAAGDRADDLVEADAAFHDVIGTPPATPSCARCCAASRRARCAHGLWHGMADRMALDQARAEHTSIYEAIAAGDADLARAATLLHIAPTRRGSGEHLGPADDVPLWPVNDRPAPSWTARLGTAPLGGLFEQVVDDAAARAVVDRRLGARGLRLFDTAPLYGSGLAEERLGRRARQPAARGVRALDQGRTRCSRPGAPSAGFPGAPPLEPVFDFCAEGILRSLEESLERLGLDAVDVALLHDPDEPHARRRDARSRRLRRASPRAVGVGTNSSQTALSFVERGDVDLLPVAGRYTLLDRSAASSCCRSARSAVSPWSPPASSTAASSPAARRSTTGRRRRMLARVAG